MPKLQLFSPCEKVIIANDNTVSLVTIFEKIQLHLPVSEDSKLPPNLQIPFKWFVFSLWMREPGDEVKEFEHQVHIVMPGNNPDKDITSNIVKFKMPETRHHMVVQFPGFPIVSEGIASVKALFREVGSEDWKTMAEYPLEVERPVKVSASVSPSASPSPSS